MRHCILMTVYKDREMINLIINSAPDNFDFFIHIDKKSNLKVDEISSRAQVFKEYKIYWGSIEHLKAFLYLMKQATSSRKSYDFFHLITGQDFYAVPFAKFDQMLLKDTPYVDCFKLPRPNWWQGGLHILRYRTLASWNDVRIPYVKFLDKSWQLLQYLSCTKRKLPNYELWGGSVYCSLPMGAVELCLNSSIAKDMLRRLDGSTCGEEVFFQTVLMNSPYKEKLVKSNLRYIDWTVPNGPKVLTLEDLKKVTSSPVLFCRKNDSLVSHDFLAELVQHIYH